MTAQHLAGHDTARLRQAAVQRVAAARDARRLIEEHADAVRAAETAAGKARDARRRATKAQAEAAERQAAVENAITAVAELLAGWARDLDERIRPAAELVDSWGRLVSDLTDAKSPAPVLAAAITRDHLNPVRRPLDRRSAAIEQHLASNAAARTRTEGELAAVEEERDPAPRDPEFWSRRERPAGIGTSGAPLWRLVETVDGAPDAQLEAALDAAGLLQAWVTPDGVYLADRDGSETVWLSDRPVAASHAMSQSAPPTQSTLRQVLRPADDAADLAEVVDRLLTSVGYGDDLSGTGTGAGTRASAGSAVSRDGRWRHGGLSGLAAPAPDGPRLLGATARAADRERRIGLLRAELAELTAIRDRLAAELDELTRLLTALDAAAERMPRDTLVVSAVLTARKADADADDAVTTAELAEGAERQARTVADGAASKVAAHCHDHGLPHGRDEVEAVLGALADYQAALDRLDSAASLLPPLRDAAEQAAESLERYREAHAKAAGDAESDRAESLSMRAKADAAQAALSREGQEILTEVSALRREIGTLAGTLKQLNIDHADLNGKKMVSRNTLERVEERREQAEAERQASADRWFGCVNTGLPRLRGIADPAASHVTAALETARAARSAISIRDWPDDVAEMTQRVQGAWGRMSGDAAILRSRLESLAGRTVRVVYPGEGAADFPGGVEVVVDGTGAALAPPAAADRLNALLLRLQADYDEELTRTINELLGSTFIEHLRDRLGEAERLRDDINTKLAQHPTSVSGITLRLQRVPVTSESTASSVLVTLERDFTLLSEPAQEQIRRFLAERINTAQEEARAKGDPDWRSRLAQILDYRCWFDLRLEYRTPQSAVGGGASGGWRTLDRGDHGLLSGGAKVVTLLQPFIAALHAMYDQANTGPRMMWLDEAFGGVDTDNKAAMFRLLASCDLDWLIAGPGIIVNSASVPLASIYEVRRAPQPWPGVSLELVLWTGNELTHVAAPDPADLPDLTPRLASPDAPDDLFSTVP
jgi:hypothetical protein